MERISYREYKMRLAWLREEWNKPSRSDHYLMQIAMEVRRVLSKRPKSIKLFHFKIPFTFRRAKAKPEMTESQKKAVIEAAKSRWLGFVTFGRKKGKPAKVVKKLMDPPEIPDGE